MALALARLGMTYHLRRTAWKLRENVTAYDAMYVALAGALDAPIVTCDTPLAKSGRRARMEVSE
ncbi:MAG TPA: PIN domain-containing protein [Vicinamibacterales bacterium]